MAIEHLVVKKEQHNKYLKEKKKKFKIKKNKIKL